MADKTKAVSDGKNSESTALMKIDPAMFPMLTGDTKEMMEAIRDNLSGQQLTQFDLTRIHVPSAGARRWTIDGGDDDPTDIEGIVIFMHLSRNYWSTSYAEGSGGPPDCSSIDAIFGRGNPGGECAACPFSKFNSAQGIGGKVGRGQACRLTEVIFILQPGNLLPSVIIAPPTSVGEVKKYTVRLTTKAKSILSTVTRFSLVQEKNKDGMPFSAIFCKPVGFLDGEQKAMMRSYIEALRPILNGITVDERVNSQRAVPVSDRAEDLDDTPTIDIDDI